MIPKEGLTLRIHAPNYIALKDNVKVGVSYDFVDLISVHTWLPHTNERARNQIFPGRKLQKLKHNRKYQFDSLVLLLWIERVLAEMYGEACEN